MAITASQSRHTSFPTYKSSKGTREEFCQKSTQSTKKDIEEERDVEKSFEKKPYPE
jgi:hypothetical protein